jgi:hypothetical protein
VDYVMRCATCHNDNRLCPGHPGIDNLRCSTQSTSTLVRKLLRTHLYQPLPLPHRRRQHRTSSPRPAKRFNSGKRMSGEELCPTYGAKDSLNKITLRHP